MVFSTIASLLLHASMILIFERWGFVEQRRELQVSSPRTGGGVEIISLGRKQLQPPSAMQLQSDITLSGTKNSQQSPVEAHDFGIALPMPMPDAERAEYLISNDLDVRPAFANPIVVPFPDGWSGGEINGEVILILYVSQAGLVEEVVVEQTNLPSAFGQSARSAFLAQQMQPGEKGGLPVPTKMKVLVEFGQ